MLNIQRGAGTPPELNPISARAHAAAGGQALAGGGGDTRIDFDTVDWDTASAITTGGGWVFTAPVAGKYRLTTMVTVEGDFAEGGWTRIDLFRNGAWGSVLQYSEANNGTGITVSWAGEDVQDLAAGDTLAVNFGNAQGGMVTAGGAAYIYVTIDRLPALVDETGGQSINARCYVGGHTFPTVATTIVQYNGVQWDTANAITTGAGWVYTAPADGKYRLSACLLILGDWIPGDMARLEVWVNGSQYCVLCAYDGLDGTFHAPFAGSTVVDLVATDEVNFRIFNDLSTDIGTASTDAFNHCSIERIAS